MTPLAADCARAREAAPELALGILDGLERSLVVEHLETCARCRADTARLTTVADELLLLVPGAEPPPGFEARVLARLPTARGRRAAFGRRGVARVAALVAAAVLGAVVLAGVGALRDDGAPAAEAGVLHAPDGRAVGRAVILGGAPAQLVMAVAADDPDDVYACIVVLRDGRALVVGSFHASEGPSVWSSDVPVAASAVQGVRVVGRDGDLLASGVLAPA